MAFTEGASDGALNGVTPVTVVAAPGAATRRIVKNIIIQNRDTASVDLTLRLVSGASTRQLWAGTLAAGDTLSFDGALVLDATDKSITAVLAGAPATTNPDFVASWGDAS